MFVCGRNGAEFGHLEGDGGVVRVAVAARRFSDEETSSLLRLRLRRSRLLPLRAVGRSSAVEHGHAVEYDDERGADVRDDRLPQSRSARQAQRQDDSLGDDGEGDVLFDFAHARLPERRRLRQPSEIVREQRHVRRLHRRRGSGDAHRHAHVRGAQRGRVVDSVPDHRQRASSEKPPTKPPRAAGVALELGDARLHLLQLTRGAQTRENVRRVDPTRRRDARGGSWVIPGEHHHLDAGVAKSREGGGRVPSDDVFASKRPRRLPLHADPHRRRARAFPRVDGVRERWVRDAPSSAIGERGAADFDQFSVDARRGALPREGLKRRDDALFRGDANGGA